mmetsp:Transcript_5933/g.17513  ORF Transcript_5933/g.17513 Transcript_5933/m.17513 type:complete len:236 (-) Transcript_5933:166-873(-)
MKCGSAYTGAGVSVEAGGRVGAGEGSGGGGGAGSADMKKVWSRGHQPPPHRAQALLFCEQEYSLGIQLRPHAHVSSRVMVQQRPCSMGAARAAAQPALYFPFASPYAALDWPIPHVQYVESLSMYDGDLTELVGKGDLASLIVGLGVAWRVYARHFMVTCDRSAIGIPGCVLYGQSSHIESEVSLAKTFFWPGSNVATTVPRSARAATIPTAKPRRRAHVPPARVSSSVGFSIAP